VASNPSGLGSSVSRLERQPDINPPSVSCTVVAPPSGRSPSGSGSKDGLYSDEQWSTVDSNISSITKRWFKTLNEREIVFGRVGLERSTLRGPNPSPAPCPVLVGPSRDKTENPIEELLRNCFKGQDQAGACHRTSNNGSKIQKGRISGKSYLALLNLGIRRS
jgi:hypothetical protein